MFAVLLTARMPLAISRLMANQNSARPVNKRISCQHKGNFEAQWQIQDVLCIDITIHECLRVCMCLCVGEWEEKADVTWCQCHFCRLFLSQIWKYLILGWLLITEYSSQTTTYIIVSDCNFGVVLYIALAPFISSALETNKYYFMLGQVWT